jgi:hypothetical protein
MNCVAGDLAMVVRLNNWRGPNRAIARALLGIPVQLTTGYLFHGAPAWRLERNVALEVNGKRFEVQGIVDEILRPIRDSNREDEVLALVGKPAVTT